MNSSPIDSLDEQTFLLIRLPRETVDKARQRESGAKAGSVFVYDDGRTEFQDSETLKMYSLLRNQSPNVKEHTILQSSQCKTSTNARSNVKSIEESDLIRISLQNDEAIHLGKVKSSVLFAVPKVDDRGASSASN